MKAFQDVIPVLCDIIKITKIIHIRHVLCDVLIRIV